MSEAPVNVKMTAAVKPAPSIKREAGVFVERSGATVRVVSYDSDGRVSPSRHITRLPGSLRRCCRREHRSLARRERKLARAKSFEVGPC